MSGDGSVTEIRRVAAQHRDAWPGIEASGGLVGADGAQPLGDLLVAENTKAQALVVGSVPRHVDVAGQHQARELVLLGPGLRRIEELATKPLPSVARVHRDLFDERIPVQGLNQQVGHGVIVLVREHQRTAVLLELGQLSDGRRVVIGNGIHAEVPKRCSRGPLHLTQHGQILNVGTANHDFLSSITCSGNGSATNPSESPTERCTSRWGSSVLASYLAVTLLAVAANTFSGVAALVRFKPILPGMAAAGVPESWLIFPIGALKTAGACRLATGGFMCYQEYGYRVGC